MLRYIVERISDGEFLELELPIVVSSAGRAFNKSAGFSGEIVPVVEAYRFAGTTELIDPGATYIHEEADGIIRGTWLVTRSTFQGAVWQIEGSTPASVFSGRPYEGEYRGVKVDPVAVARHVAQHAQSFADADFGITVVGSSSVRVGTDSDDKQTAAQKAADTAKAAVDAAKKTYTAAQDRYKANRSPENKAAVDAAKAVLDQKNEAKKKADDALSAAKDKVRDDGGAWKILWWDTPNCLNAMQEAIDAAGMEWYEHSAWNSDRTAISKEIRVVPRVGKKRDDLSFIEGDNIIEAVTVESDLNDYANTIVAVGAGEGRDALRVTVAKKTTRRRITRVLEAKDVTKKAALETLANTELAIRSKTFRVKAVRLINHPNAAFGVFDVGDTILVDIDGGWIGRQRLWQRIEEVEYIGEDIADLMLGEA